MGLLDFDFNFFLFGFFGFRERDFQKPVLIRGIDLITLDLPGKPNRTGKGSITSFNEVVIFLSICQVSFLLLYPQPKEFYCLLWFFFVFYFHGLAG